MNKKQMRNKNIKKTGNKYWIYGKHAVFSAINNPKRKIHRILATSKGDFDAQIVKSEEIERILSQDAVHQGVACEVERLPGADIEDVFDSKLLVILDQVTDPHNVGAILRSCAAFGAGGVIMPKDNSPDEGGVLAKSASGALEVVPLIKVTNISKTIEYLKENGFWCIGMDGEAKTSIKDAPDYDKTVLIMGAEGKGMRRLTREHADLLVKLPITDKVESLNVSNAAAIALYKLS